MKKSKTIIVSIIPLNDIILVASGRNEPQDFASCKVWVLSVSYNTHFGVIWVQRAQMGKTIKKYTGLRVGEIRKL